MFEERHESEAAQEKNLRPARARLSTHKQTTNKACAVSLNTPWSRFSSRSAGGPSERDMENETHTHTHRRTKTLVGQLSVGD